MEIANDECMVLEEVVGKQHQEALGELLDCELALVGGGNGIVIFP